MSFIVAGIHTGIGKTICSAILTEALEYDYWKPVQAGELELSDSIFVQQHIQNKKSIIHPELYKLKMAASPHAAAANENITIHPEDIKLPVSENQLIVETAGGLLSPLSISFTNLDLIKHLNLPVVLVSNDYLGSINHTLLTIEILRFHQIQLLGIIFSGNETPSSRELILERTQLPMILSIPQFDILSSEALVSFAHQIRISIKHTFHELTRER